MAKVNGQATTKEVITNRFQVDLELEGKDSFSEFSYALLLKERRKSQKAEPLSSSFVSDGSCSGLPGGDESRENLAAIAKKFEEKYGPKYSKKRKRMIRNSDYIDRGSGYDLDDPFVDDSETYEDFVPDHLETKYGGFYINTGRLEFKTSEDMHEIDHFIKNKPSIKKQPSHQTPQTILANQKLKKAKQHVALQKGSVATKFNGTAMRPPPLKKVDKKTPSIGNKPKPSITSGPVAAINIGSKCLNVPILPTGSDASPVIFSQPTSKPENVSEEKPAVEKQHPTLPPNLPPNVLQRINMCIEVPSNDQKKMSNQQRENQLEKLFEVEIACRSISIKLRNAVFEYLAYKIGIARGTLTKRLKQFVKKKEEISLAEPLAKLRQAIESSMPKQLVLFEEEVKKARLEHPTLSDKTLPDGEEDTKTGFEKVSESPGMETPSIGTHGVDSTSSTLLDQATSQPQTEAVNAKAKRLPRKKYHWNDNEEVKTLLLDVTRIKVTLETHSSRLNKEKGEEVILQFLEETVRPLWPKGWMQKSILYKLTEPVHKSYTSKKLSQAKKVAVVASAKKEKVIVKQLPVSSSPSKVQDKTKETGLKTVTCVSSAITATPDPVARITPSTTAQTFIKEAIKTVLSASPPAPPIAVSPYTKTSAPLNTSGISPQLYSKQNVKKEVQTTGFLNVTSSSSSRAVGHSVKQILSVSPAVSLAKFDLSIGALQGSGIIKQASASPPLKISTHPINRSPQAQVFSNSSYLSPASLTQQITGALTLASTAGVLQPIVSYRGTQTVHNMAPSVPITIASSPVGIMGSKKRKFSASSNTVLKSNTHTIPNLVPSVASSGTLNSINRQLMSSSQQRAPSNQVNVNPTPKPQPKELSQGHSPLDLIKKEHCYSEGSSHSHFEQRK